VLQVSLVMMVHKAQPVHPVAVVKLVFPVVMDVPVNQVLPVPLVHQAKPLKVSTVVMEQKVPPQQ
jgi:hypothetical protein